MDMPQDFILDFQSVRGRSQRGIEATLEQSGGLPTVVIPVDETGKPIATGIGCATRSELLEAIVYIYHRKSKRMKLVAAQKAPTPSE